MSTRVVLLLLVCILLFHQSYGKEYIDLSYDIGEDSAFWPNGEAYSRKTMARGYTEGGYWYESYHICLSEHTGTHLDAPSHFAEGKWTTDEIPLSHLMGPGVVMDIQDKVAKDSNAELSTDDFMAWLDEHGPLPDGVIIFIRTGWASRYGNYSEYFGFASNDTSNLNFPGISSGAAQLMVGYEGVSGRKIVGVGLDTPSLDYGQSKDFKTHQTLSEANIYGLENVANLNTLPTKGFDILVMHTKLRGGSGAPARILATLPSSGAAASTSAIMGIQLIVASVLLLGYSFHL